MSHSDSRLSSVWDMLKQYSSRFATLAAHLAQIDTGLQLQNANPYAPPDELTFTVLGFALADGRSLADELELDAVLALIQRMERSVQNRNTYAVCSALDDVRNLISRIQDQLASRQFYYLRPRVSSFYGADSLFGTAVNDRFPKAQDDIRDAGNCLALGQGTACVMHLMRVTEVGLKALAADLSIPYAPSWESYLSQIEKQMAIKHASKSVKWKRHQKFYRDVQGDLVAVKIAWRNPTMHIERRYDPEEAQRVLEAVKGLMQHLATRLKS